MKVRKISEHIYSLGIWIVIPIHVWIVVEDDGLTLVDAGIGPMARGILRFVDRLGKGKLKRILLTHGHSDHVGAVALLKKSHDVPVLVHPIEMPYMGGRLPHLRRRKAVEFLPKGVATPLDLDADGRPARVGRLRPFLTPGHSPGHVVYMHEDDGVMLAGDLFTSRRGRLRRPIPQFTGDMAEAIRSSSVLEVVRPRQLEVCHGDSSVMNPAEQLQAYLKETRNLAEKRTSVRSPGLRRATE